MSQPLCEQYEDVSIDVTISGGLASGTNYDFNGKHVLFSGSLILDSDIDFTGAIIRIDGGSIDQSVFKKTVKFNNSKVYAECSKKGEESIGVIRY